VNSSCGRWNPTLAIKRHLQNVCISLSRIWAWKAEAIHYLYEDIRLDSVQQIETLIATLSSSTQRSEHLRSYVVRLDLLAPGLKWTWDPQAPPIAIRLCKLTPNLKTLISTISQQSEPHAIPGFLPPALERLCFVDAFALPGQVWVSTVGVGKPPIPPPVRLQGQGEILALFIRALLRSLE